MSDWDAVMTDALAEVMNMAVGGASELLSSMVQEEIILKVPKLEFGSLAEVYGKISAREGSSLVAIQERFDGTFSGEALLIFPAEQSLTLVASILDSGDLTENISEIAREALMEVGNIILNSCLGTICNLLGYEVETGLPVFQNWQAEDEGAGGDPGIFVHINFQMNKGGTTGYLVIFMSQSSLETLRAGIVKLVESYG